MIEITGPGEAASAKTLAAVMAAVQAYLDDERRATDAPKTNTLAAWKTAPWEFLRGEVPRPTPSSHRGYSPYWKR